MGKSRHKVFTSKEEREDKETIRKLKETVRDLLSENKKLRSELSTLEQAFERTCKFMKDENEDLTVEELIKAANNHFTSKQAKKEKREKKKVVTNNNTKDDTNEKEQTREKWKKWRESNFGKYKEDS